MTDTTTPFRIGADLDGVTYRFDDKMRGYLVEHRGYKAKELPEPVRWAHWDVWPLTKREWLTYFADGIEAGYIFSGDATDAYEGALHTLGAWCAEGHEVHVVTHRPPEAEAITVEWLAAADVPHTSLTFSADKTCVPVDVMLEDNIDNALACAEAGIPVLLFDHTWNREVWVHEGEEWDADGLITLKGRGLIRRVSGWEEAYRIVYDMAHPMPEPLASIIGEDSTNPKDRIGLTKPRVDLVPPAAIIEMARALANGADKYGAYNWREKDVRLTVYIAAAIRHLLQLLDGEDAASDSDVLHVGHVMACMGIVADAYHGGHLVDDRPPTGSAARIIAEYTTPTS